MAIVMTGSWGCLRGTPSKSTLVRNQKEHWQSQWHPAMLQTQDSTWYLFSGTSHEVGVPTAFLGSNKIKRSIHTHPSQGAGSFIKRKILDVEDFFLDTNPSPWRPSKGDVEFAANLGKAGSTRKIEIVARDLDTGKAVKRAVLSEKDVNELIQIIIDYNQLGK